MVDMYAIYAPGGGGIDGPQPEPYTYFSLSCTACPDGSYVARHRDTGVEEILYVYRDRAWMPWEPPLGEQQQRAYDAVLAGRSCFITGVGGTGKSMLTQRFVRDMRLKGKRVAVCASTGIAAVTVGGITIHSCLGTGLCSSVDDVKAKASSDAFSKAMDRFSAIDVVVIDEVSMLLGDYIDMVDYWLRRIAGAIHEGRDKLPFGGWQIILIGDALQLPPVIKGAQAAKVTHKYFFQAPAFTAANFDTHYLRKGYRQNDAEFRKHLARIRKGNAPEDTLEYFNARLNAPLPNGAVPTQLFSTNREVDEVNERELEGLPGLESMFEVSITGHPSWGDAMRKNLACEEYLRLKVGAEVMFIKNNRAAGYVNGTRGRVEALSPISIRVRCYDGTAVDAKKEKWEMRNAQDTVLATAEQYPLRLARAITTHRSQGQSLDYMAFDPSQVFERAQAYVALSRVRSIDGLVLFSKLTARHVRASKPCVAFYRDLLEREQGVQT